MIRIPPNQPSVPAHPQKPSKKLSTQSHFELPKRPIPVKEKDQKILEKAAASLMDEVKNPLPLDHLTARITVSVLKREPALDKETDKAILAFAEDCIESLRESYHSPLEPFHIFADRIREQIISDADGFRTRLENGYQVLKKEKI